MRFRTVYIGVGSNLGDRKAILEEGIALLERELVELKSIKSLTEAPIYETQAWGMPEGTPAFLNLVVAIDTDLELEDLLRLLLEVEKGCGRKRGESKGYSDRTLDLDILLDGDTILKTLELEVPHPRMLERRFVLKPLSDLDSEMKIPGIKISVGEALEVCPKKPEVRLF
ncbi:MAG TPA: 2-amino-4-hydroxy-6-hydroxymethyldihydropteridine diphosphokinase [Flavobacteriales bacterium]|jgi:2-amino-4-hydroxy-6-hydroxymethyldihydropteridine diphosphokinase|nr:2-amino-4-hydroxy-6-hydroxymethyldihydropteridine diphosphokinase [Flavobacteriales bacterium]HIO16608.1 2-amino-4-hydroxy-6-hydroxymethyldihydropteridine diphosphokinase [Flavobacteriales bacterium]HIO59397.1 2-amino-4-hydroxy-6-hydroxymethyldihydropteridine diphosphokinase [Flavobacteriales bacterium]